MPQNLFAQIVCPSPTVWDFDEKRLNWASIIRDWSHHLGEIQQKVHVVVPFELRKFNDVHKYYLRERSYDLDFCNPFTFLFYSYF
jgi:hypothetical protein